MICIKRLFTAFLMLSGKVALSQDVPDLSDIKYPYQVNRIYVPIEQKSVKLAYMDVVPLLPNGKTVLLLHGKNFNGYYWKNIIPFFTDSGYRVVVPDQIGFGESYKPDIHYSFHQMASNTKSMLDSLKINSVIVLGHSMGGMLAVRFALMYPNFVSKLILENPIGLEDYKTFVPYIPLDSLLKEELKVTYESYKKYQQSYYPEWKPEYEDYVKAQSIPLTKPGFSQVAWANALTYQMIYEQPIVYELGNITAKTLLLIGQADRTIVGKNHLSKESADVHGQYTLLGKKLKEQIKNSELIELEGVGHIPHIQVPDSFKLYVSHFLYK